jgi:hypothetical protein
MPKTYRGVLPLLFALTAAFTGARAASPTLTIDATSPAAKVSPMFYGLMT